MMYIRGGGDNITELEWVSEFASSDETTSVSDIGHQESIVLIGNGAEGGIVPIARIRGSAADNKAGPKDFCLRRKSFVVD